MSDQVDVGSGKFYGWMNVLFLFILYSAVMGFVFYGFSVIFPAMITAEGWGRGEASLAHTIRGLAVGFMTPFAAFCIARMGAQKTLRVGLTIGVIALGLLGTVTTKLWQWTIIWGFLMPTAFSLGGLLPIQATVNFWFNKKRATALGIVMTGAPLGGVLAAPLYTYIIKQTGMWKSGWLMAAGICLVCALITFLVKNTPGSIGQHPDGIDPDAPQPEQTGTTPKAVGPYQTKEVWTLKEAIRTKTVWFLLACMIGQGWALYMMTVHGVLHLQDVGFSAMESASVFGIFIFCAGFARFPIGILTDRVEPRVISTAALLGMTIALFAFWKTPPGIPAALCITGAYGLCFGATVITFPMIMSNYFGPQAFAAVNGFLIPIMIPITAPVPLLAGLIFDKFGNYDFAFIPILVFLLLATIFAWFLYPPQKKEAAAE